GAAAVGLVAGMKVLGEVEPQTAAPSPRDEPAGLASDAAEPASALPAAIPEATDRSPLPPRPVEDATATGSDAPEPSPTGPSTPVRKKARPRRGELKPNPYDRG